jgi:prevent-host-death family protein
VYSSQLRDTNLWTVSLEGQPRLGAAPVALSTFDEHAPDYSSDGKRLAFASTRSDVEEIWISDAEGAKPVQVTNTGGTKCANPRWSRDGRTIVLNSRREGSDDLYLLRPDSGELRRITDDPAEEGEPRWSRAGSTIYFPSNRTGRYEGWRMPAAEAVGCDVIASRDPAGFPESPCASATRPRSWHGSSRNDIGRVFPTTTLDAGKRRRHGYRPQTKRIYGESGQFTCGRRFDSLLAARRALPCCHISDYGVATVERVGVRRLRDGLSRYIRRAARGERIVVTEHNQPVASLGPALESDDDRVLLELLHEGLAEWGGGKPEGARRPARVKGRSVAQAVIEDRR